MTCNGQFGRLRVWCAITRARADCNALAGRLSGPSAAPSSGAPPHGLRAKTLFLLLWPLRGPPPAREEVEEEEEEEAVGQEGLGMGEGLVHERTRASP